MMDLLNRLEITQAFLIGLVLTVMYYFLMFDNGQAILQQVDDLKKQYQSQQVTLKKIKKALEDKRRFEQEAEEINTNLEAFLRYFPSESDQNKLMKEVSQSAEVHQVTVLSLKPVDRAPEFPSYPETAFSFEVEGTFNQIMGFISNLTQLKRAIDFKKTEIRTSNSGQDPILKFTSTLVIFGRSPDGSGS